MNILIVEDQEGVAIVLKHFLEPISSEIITAWNMEEALKAIASDTPIDIITVDLGLPDSGVLDTVSQIKVIRRSRPDALIVVVTGQILSPEIEAETIDSGADGIVYKQGVDFTPNGFLQFIGALVSKYMKSPQNYSRSVTVLERVSEKLAQLANKEKNTVDIPA